MKDVINFIKITAVEVIKKIKIIDHTSRIISFWKL